MARSILPVMAWSILGAGCTPTPMEVVPVWDLPGADDDEEDGSSGDDSGAAVPEEDEGTSGPELPEDEDTDTSDEDEDDEEDEGTGEDDDSVGDVGDCHPQLVEISFDPRSQNDGHQWIKLYNPCARVIDLGKYSLGWGGSNYTMGSLDLMDEQLGVAECFVVGGPYSADSNDFPIIDQAEDLQPDLWLGGEHADGVALFDMESDDVDAWTVPVDAVIYGDENRSGLMDATGIVPVPHVGTGPNKSTVRRVGPQPFAWIVEHSPSPNSCPPY